MEDKIKSAFQDVHMDDACASRIEAEMRNRSVRVKNPSFRLWRTVSVMATALALIMLIVVGNADVVEAFTANFTKPTEPRYYTSKFYHVDVKKGEGHINDVFLMCVSVRDGRLYFVANDENIDVTEAFSDEVPFEYFFIDENGFLNYIALGGQFGGTKESLKKVGYHYYFWYPDLNSDGIYNDGGGGAGLGHWNRETEDYYEWYKIAEETWKAISFTQRETE